MDSNVFRSEEAAELRLLRPGVNPASVLQDYWELVKPEIAFLVVLSALAGFMLGAGESVNPLLLALTLGGTALASAGGGVLNHYIERNDDALMRRTAQRPLPSGRIRAGAALTFGLILITGGLTLLWWVNYITLLLAALTIVLYLFAYTPLKRRTTYNTLIGTIPGALPALGGYVAATGTVGTGGWILFSILALWQMPHFLALAWMYRKDYARGGHAMFPVQNPDGRATAKRTLLYSTLLLGTSLLPTVLDYTGWLYLAIIIPTGIGFILPAIGFYRKQTPRLARKILLASIVYVPLLVTAIAADLWLL